MAISTQGRGEFGKKQKAAVAHEVSVHPETSKAEAENEDENEDNGCRLIPTTYYLFPGSELAVQPAVLDGLGEMMGGDVGDAFQVGDGPGDPQHLVVGAG